MSGVQPLRLPGLSCACGDDRLVAVAPGTEAPRFADLFTVARGERRQGWCATCWPWGVLASTASSRAAVETAGEGELG